MVKKNKKRSEVILGLDISSSSTGWAVLKNGRFYAREGLDYGWIKLKSSISLAERLHLFSNEIERIISIVNPSFVGIEDVFYSRNAAVLKLLSRFSGVACEQVYSLLSYEPIIAEVRSIRAVLGSQEKEKIFELIKNKYKLYKWSFKTHNDITDAIAITLYVRQKNKEK